MADDANKMTFEAPCMKCDGDGFIKAFSHISNGRCFSCGGAGRRQYTMKGVRFAGETRKGRVYVDDRAKAVYVVEGNGELYECTGPSDPIFIAVKAELA